MILEQGMNSFSFRRLLLFVFFAMTLKLSHSFVPDPCFFWEGAAYVNGKCYKIFSEKLDWNGAKEFCGKEKNGGILAELKTDAEISVFVFTLRRDQQSVPRQVWLGASDVNLHGEFVWASTKTLIDPNLGNRLNNSHNGGCVKIEDVSGTLTVENCDLRTDFACQHDAIVDPCYFWTDATYVNGKCFKVFNDHLDWNEAERFCANNITGGGLAELMTEGEMNAVRSFKEGFADISTVWLGGKDIGINGNFVSLVPLATSPLSSNIQPTVSGGCIILNSIGIFETRNCADKNIFICQRDERREKQKRLLLDTVQGPCYFWENSFYINGTCVKGFTGQARWSKAQEICENETSGGTLLELSTFERRKAMVSLNRDLNSFQTFWVGATNVDGTYVWMSNKEVVQNVSTEGQSDINLCIQLRRNGVFSNGLCDIKLPFYCQQDVQNPCEYFTSGGEYYRGQCFFYSQESLIYTKIDKFCRKLNAFVVEPSTPDLDLYVSDMATRYESDSVDGNDHRVWIGGKFDQSGAMKWSTSGTLVENQSWRTLFQNKQDDDNCYLEKSTSQWFSIKKSRATAICQMDLGNPCEIDLPGAVYDSTQCFKFYNKSMTWTDAQEFCHEREASLAAPRTTELLIALNNYLKYINAYPTHQALWLGLTGEEARNLSRRANDSTGTYVTATGPDSFLTIDSNGAILKGSDTDKNVFVCQKGASSKKRIGFNYVIPVPSLQISEAADQTSFIQFSNSLRTSNTYLQIDVYLENGAFNITNTFIPPAKAFTFYLDSSIALSSTGTFPMYAIAKTTEPVTIVLYIMSETFYSAASMLAFTRPRADITDSFNLFFLVSALLNQEQDSVLTITALANGGSNITVNFRDNRTMITTAEGILYSQLAQIKGEVSQFHTLNILGGSLDASYLKASQTISVSLGGKTSIGTDSTLDQLLPFWLLSPEYVTFPSQPTKNSLLDTFKLVAVFESTTVEIFRAQSLGGNLKVSLNAIGDVKIQTLPRTHFFLLKGNKAFSVFKLSDSGPSVPDQGSCLTSLLHSDLWLYQYDLEITKELNRFQVFVTLIVPTETASSITTGFSDVPTPSCQAIEGSSWSGCFFQLPAIEGRYYHIHETKHQDKFGAYMYAIGVQGNSTMCHPLGMKHNPSITVDFDYKTYISILEEKWNMPDNCESAPSTTEITIDDNTTYEITTEEYTTLAYTTENDLTSKHSNFASRNSTPTPGFITTEPFFNISALEKKQLVEDIERNLYVNVRNTSSFKRKFISASDLRVSSQTIGWTGIVFLVLFFSLIFYNDILIFFPLWYRGRDG